MRRIVITAVAGLVVLVSVIGLMLYVSNADSRAASKFESRTVLVAIQTIPQGTSAKVAKTMMIEKKIPTTAIIGDAYTSKSQIKDDQAVISTIQKDEQVLTARFGTAAQAASNGSIPKGKQLVSFVINADRLNGGNVAAGDAIGIFMTANLKLIGAPAGLPSDAESRTKLVLSRVPVVAVTGAVINQTAATAAPAASSSAVPLNAGALLVTVAVDSKDAEKLIWGIENARIYATIQNKDTNVTVDVFPAGAQAVMGK